MQYIVHYTDNSGRRKLSHPGLTGLMAYDFAGVAYEFCGGLWLSTFHGSLRRWLGV